MAAPVLLSLTYNGAEVQLGYDQALDTASVPDTDRFFLRRGSQRTVVSAVAIAGSVVTLTLAASLPSSGAVRLWLFGGSSPIQNIAGEDAPTFNMQNVGYAARGAPVFDPNTALEVAWLQGFAITPIIIPEINVFPPPTYAPVGSLPAGITFNGATREVAGTPTAIISGNVVIRATNSIGSADYTQPFATTVPIPSAPVFDDDEGADQTWVVGEAITTIIVPAAAGFPAPTYASVGSLPAGITFDETTRELDGTPTGLGAGSIRIRASNSQGMADWVQAHAIVAEVDVDPPNLLTAAIDGQTLTLIYDEDLDEASIPSQSAFTVEINGSERTVIDVRVSGDRITLYLRQSADRNDRITLDYAVPADNPLQDITGNNAATYSNRAVINRTPAIEPALLDAVVAGTIIQVAYSHKLDTTSVPATTAYAIEINGVEIDVNSVAIVGASVILTLATAVAAASGQTVILSYAPPSASPAESLDGVAVAPIDRIQVENLTASPAAPTLIEVLARVTTIFARFDQLLDARTVPALSKFETILPTAPVGGRVSYTTPGSYNWVVPAGIAMLEVEMQGGGGGGGGGGGAGGPGGTATSSGGGGDAGDGAGDAGDGATGRRHASGGGGGAAEDHGGGSGADRPVRNSETGGVGGSIPNGDGMRGSHDGSQGGGGGGGGGGGAKGSNSSITVGAIDHTADGGSGGGGGGGGHGGHDTIIADVDGSPGGSGSNAAGSPGGGGGPARGAGSPSRGGSGGRSDPGEILNVSIVVTAGQVLTLHVGGGGNGGGAGGGGSSTGFGAPAGDDGDLGIDGPSGVITIRYTAGTTVDLTAIQLVGDTIIITAANTIDTAGSLDLNYRSIDPAPKLRSITTLEVAAFRRTIGAASLSPEQYRQFLATDISLRDITSARSDIVSQAIGIQHPTYELRMLVDIMDPDNRWPRDRLWTGAGDLTYQGQVYKGLGLITSFAALPISPDRQGLASEIGISAADSLVRAAALQDIGNLPIRLSWIYSDTEGRSWSSAPLSALGLLNGATLKGAEYKATIILGAQVAIDPARIFEWTHENALSRDTDFGGFEFMRQLEDGVIIDWPPKGK